MVVVDDAEYRGLEEATLGMLWDDAVALFPKLNQIAVEHTGQRHLQATEPLRIVRWRLSERGIPFVCCAPQMAGPKIAGDG